jgi:hypothetical protein
MSFNAQSLEVSSCNFQLLHSFLIYSDFYRTTFSHLTPSTQFKARLRLVADWHGIARSLIRLWLDDHLLRQGRNHCPASTLIM